MSRKKGIFITFEGPEGSGKSTHLKLLAAWLEKQGGKVWTTREPGGTDISQPIRDILLNTTVPLDPQAELLLFEADRAQHVALIRSHLEQGTLVLCDRYTDSTLAYQGYGRGLDIKMIQQLNKVASGGLIPNLTILLDIASNQGLKQAKQAKNGHDRMEQAGPTFHANVRKGFLALAKKEPKRFRIIRQQASIEETQQLIRNVVIPAIRKRGSTINVHDRSSITHIGDDNR